MQSQKKQQTVTILELTPEESDWLHRVMQNPLWGTEPAEEEESDRVMRKKFFNATEFLWSGL